MSAFGDQRQFIVWRGSDKSPIDPLHAEPTSDYARSNAQYPATWLPYAVAAEYARSLGAGYGVGIVITEGSQLFALDLDGCLVGGVLTPTAHAVVRTYRALGAYIEVSMSGRGIHIIGTYAGPAPPHRCKNAEHHFEMYLARRYIALTGKPLDGEALGDTRADCTAALCSTAQDYFPPEPTHTDAGNWTAEDDPACTITGSDDERLAQALKSKSMAARFGGDKVTFRQLWEADADALGKAFPPNKPGQAFDASSADQALCNHLAYWYANNCERILTVIHGSALRRDKWDRPDYIRTTILKACALPKAWKPRRDTPAVPAPPVTPELGTLPTPLGVMHYGLLRTNLRHDPIADEENVRLLLENEPNLQGIARFNEFSGELILVRPITSDPEVVSERGIPRAWTDTDTATLQTFIQKHYIPKIAREKIDAIVSMHARQRCAFHPVRDYLQSLEWDGVPRLDTWMRDYWGAAKQPTEYLAAVGAAWMISAVARIMQPGCQADYALVLEGDQGVRKSTALRILAGDDHFSDSLPADLSHKDARDHLRGKWIVELPELAQFKRNEIETVKAFITRRHEQYRPSYGRHEIRFPRQCVFAGSTNDETYLVDTTGNRRFWVIACAGVNLEATKRDRDQLWAEAAARYRKGERWYLTPAQEALAAVEAAARVAHDPWTSQVADIVAQKVKRADASPGEVMEQMNLPTTERHARNAARVGSVLVTLGWKRINRDRTRGQLYLRPGCSLPAPSFYGHTPRM